MNLQLLCSWGLLADIDIKFAELLCRLGENSQALKLAAALVSNITTSGKHICLALESVAGKSFTEVFPQIPEQILVEFAELKCPELSAWSTQLTKSFMVGTPGDYKPLVLDSHNRLYMYRYWEYENNLAANIKARLDKPLEKIDCHAVSYSFKHYWQTAPACPEWQKVATFTALTRKFCVISGGPGTGKTHTVSVLLALLLEHDDFRIELCAPTGKAAARLQESIRVSIAKLPCSEALRQKIPNKTATLHRTLGYKNNSPFFRYNRDNPLLVDVLILDEASMVPLALMSKLMDALPSHAKIILLGDQDQLASVEAGAVLGDICSAAAINCFSHTFHTLYTRVSGEKLPQETYEKSSLLDCSVQLRHSYRFKKDSGIAKISSAVNAGQADAVFDILKQGHPDLSWHNLPEQTKLKEFMHKIVLTRFKPCIKARTIQKAFQYQKTFQILCLHRSGHYGVAGINRLCENILWEEGLINTSGQFYEGRPIMITTNDYNLKLFNGDIGLILKTPSNQLRAYFPDDDNFRSLAPGRLPQHETVYAMTVHKSQGSEFDHLLMLLPEYQSPLLTRELIYTGITRARKSIEIWTKPEILKKGVNQIFHRSSGLRDKLIQ